MADRRELCPLPDVPLRRPDATQNDCPTPTVRRGCCALSATAFGGTATDRAPLISNSSGIIRNSQYTSQWFGCQRAGRINGSFPAPRWRVAPERREPRPVCLAAAAVTIAEYRVGIELAGTPDRVAERAGACGDYLGCRGARLNRDHCGLPRTADRTCPASQNPARRPRSDHRCACRTDRPDNPDLRCEGALRRSSRSQRH